MILFEGENFGEIYDALRTASGGLVHASPRGLATREFPGPVAWTIRNPTCPWLKLAGRRLNPFFAAAEILWILGGRSDVAWISRWCRNIAQFSDDGVAFNAAYGQRLRRYESTWGVVDQVDRVVRRLAEDPETRRAIVCLWDVWRDNLDSKDIACNNIVAFTIRDARLHTSIFQRSNDLVWGTPYNMLQFEHLAQLVLGEVRAAAPEYAVQVQRGTHTVVVNNLHYYLDLYPETLDAFTKGFCFHSGGLAHTCAVTSRTIYDILRWLDEEEPELEDWIQRAALGYWWRLGVMAALYLAVSGKRITRRRLISIVSQSLPEFSWWVEDFYGG